MTTHDNFSQGVEELMNEIRALAAEAEKMLGQAAVEHSEEALAALKARLESAQERLTAAYGRARKKVADGAECADETIRDNPYQALAIALGVGVLVGVLLGRRGR